MAGNRIWWAVYHYHFNHDHDMNSKQRLHKITKQVHLYSSLATVALLLMYILTSYMMIYHDWFKVERSEDNPIVIDVTIEEVKDENWETFLKVNNIAGRLTRENFQKNGDMVKTYSSAKGNSKVRIVNDKNEVEIIHTELNLSGKIIGLHRLRGYGGSAIYNFYAILLDIVGISLILFAITGVILWMKLLKHDKIAWTMLLLGFIYVSSVIGYLMLF
jgi:hypothetical protein